ncbi:MAG: tRNA (adenosine(37)-N6)-threonylcarbamoyltransferase complex dimerization subunit type 1 TsaB [Brachymonas sp.]|nr:tRNA (adenosine(37)-N6)-threonylcarbamoyltransferase complex dimerization subunit type 1 TsaB [Brachymonas sp.]
MKHTAPLPQRLLALDTSTDRLSVAVGAGQVWTHEGAGGAAASASLIPAILQLLQQAGLAVTQLDAIAVGIGPGSFTGLRTACAVAQGLALGADLPVLPISTLLAVAEDWRAQHAAPQTAGSVWALLDARMNEIYAAHWQWQTDEDGTVQWQCLHTPVLVAPENLLALPGLQAGAHMAGNVQAVYGERLPLPIAPAWPTAAALLRLAPQLWQQGLAVDAALLIPHYVRDKVAQTTAERLAQKSGAA